ncbi:MAG: HAMP domain-containing histidine kinase [Proteobacteria bacterium]|nr:HAMP domain-containing histidine kinase [Pseudomonadota bacterium]
MNEIEIYIGALIITVSLILAWVYYARNLHLANKNQILTETIAINTTVNNLAEVLRNENDLHRALDCLLSTINNLVGADGILIVRQNGEMQRILAETYSNAKLRAFFINHTIDNKAMIEAAQSKEMAVVHYTMGSNEYLNSVVIGQNSNEGDVIIVTHIISDVAVSISELGQYNSKLLQHLSQFVMLALKLNKQRELDELMGQKEESDRRSAELAARLEQELEYKELQNDFISMASHEFRTPLAVISSSIYIIQRQIKSLYEGWKKVVTAEGDQVVLAELTNQEAQEKNEHGYQKTIELINNINSYVNHLSGMIGSTLKMAIMDEKGIQNSIEPIDLGERVQAVIGKLQHLRGDVAIEYKNNAQGEKILFDSGNLDHVLTNLVSNAIKYSKANTKVEVLVKSASKNSAKLIVKDHGIGIPKEQVDKLFAKFFRGHNTTGITGIGVGLYVTKKLLILNHAEVDVESTEGVGTTFTVTFKAEPKSLQ